MTDPVPVRVLECGNFDVEIFFEGRFDQHGVVRLQRVPEGLVLWVGGEIAYRSYRR